MVTLLQPPAGSAWGVSYSSCSSSSQSLCCILCCAGALNFILFQPPGGASARATHRAPETGPGNVAAGMQQLTLGTMHFPFLQFCLYAVPIIDLFFLLTYCSRWKSCRRSTCPTVWGWERKWQWWCSSWSRGLAWEACHRTRICENPPRPHGHQKR